MTPEQTAIDLVRQWQIDCRPMLDSVDVDELVKRVTAALVRSSLTRTEPKS